jgi:hypothetical protein
MHTEDQIAGVGCDHDTNPFPFDLSKITSLPIRHSLNPERAGDDELGIGTGQLVEP